MALVHEQITGLKASLRGMLESYDVLVNESGLRNNDIAIGCVERARNVLAKYDVSQPTYTRITIQDIGDKPYDEAYMWFGAARIALREYPFPHQGVANLLDDTDCLEIGVLSASDAKEIEAWCRSLRAGVYCPFVFTREPLPSTPVGVTFHENETGRWTYQIQGHTADLELNSPQEVLREFARRYHVTT